MNKTGKATLPLFCFGVGALLYAWAGDPDFISVLTREDGPVENLSALFYLAGIGVSAVAFYRRRIALAFVWMVVCFVLLGEETSWFQRLLDYSVPAVEQRNAQGEFNIHNLEIFQGGRFLGEEIALGSLLKSQNIFRMAFFGYFLILPLLAFAPRIRKLLDWTGYEKPGFDFALAVFLLFSVSFALAVGSPITVRNGIAETREMLYALFILVYLILYILSRPEAGTEKGSPVQMRQAD